MHPNPIWNLSATHMTTEKLGLLPEFLSNLDPDSAVSQIHKNYTHGGGWQDMQGFELTPQNRLRFPGAPLLRPLAWAQLRDEIIVLYDYAIVAVIQPDRSFRVARID